MIDGVTVKKLVVRDDVPDTDQTTKRGFLMEVLRNDDRLLKKFGQSTFTVTHPHTVKAFHKHDRQDDLWFVSSGRARIVLYDDRPASPTYRERMTLIAGEGEYKLILIPAGVAHGFQVVSDSPVFLFYHTTESYDPKNPDELRIPYNDPAIGFAWESAI